MEERNAVAVEVKTTENEKNYAAMWNGESQEVVGKDWASWTPERNDEMLERITGETVALSDVVNTQINVTDIYLENVQIADENTGEMRILPRILMMCKDGRTVSCVSMTAFSALSKIMRFKGTPTPENPLTLKPIQNKKGAKVYYNFQVIKK